MGIGKKLKSRTRREAVVIDEELLLEPKKSFGDRLVTYSDFGTSEEVKKEVDPFRHEDE